MRRASTMCVRPSTIDVQQAARARRCRPCAACRRRRSRKSSQALRRRPASRQRLAGPARPPRGRRLRDRCTRRGDRREILVRSSSSWPQRLAVRRACGSMKPVSNRAAWKSSSSRIHWKNGIVVRMPRTSYSASARRMRAIACSRVSPQVIELRDHRVVEDRHLAALVTPLSSRTPGPLRHAQPRIAPGRRQEAVVGILGIDAALDGVAAR